MTLMTTRREFLKTTAGAAILGGALPRLLTAQPNKSLDILVLGGTGFIGPHLVRHAGDRGIVVRPTYIVGPGDTSDRFPYWPVRLARGGEVLAPGHADDPMQIIDVRDLTEFMVRLAESDKRGIFNVAGPKEPLTARNFYESAKQILNANVNYTFV